VGAVSATKAVGYARVSTPEQSEKDLSLPAQMAAIRKYAQDHGVELVGERRSRHPAARRTSWPSTLARLSCCARFFQRYLAGSGGPQPSA
jgi:hypothetical protein